MTSLRARIALLLVAAIVGVVALATLAAVSAMRAPNLETTIEPVARQIRLLAQSFPGRAPQSDDIKRDLSNRPAKGEDDERATYVLERALENSGAPLPAAVVRVAGKPGMVAPVQLPDGRWMTVDIPDFSPPEDRWLVLAGWITLIVLGAAAVSFYTATVLTRPLVMLEAAAARIGPDGILAPLPEEGSGEVRATARALNQLSSRLKSAMESRMHLVAAAGHDLRTPMTRMRLTPGGRRSPAHLAGCSGKKPSTYPY
ncbi:MAG: HAMP domain-containing protein [Mesorhizobium sp.]|uniref:HAMP domain-containing protein n=2 Tax=Mesorhizobium TaxID=68287 RepID=UPI000F74E2C1|nr:MULTISPECIES: HAMP domain-containing protein [unclassified Mesorhizobium]AZO61953.1 HAMP domain-containing protein [Mesorhizobium sp. M1A.F.Ca.IN.022.06.1.1]MCT2580712.1 HAMP domain-containing protein [Mesorhizobium sp. P13.3]MDF3169654.1 HAMP domain-containing protein [Mesorhizobium sp. P16.1]MDF3179494.1 HAMP domain-containing protein [Mesorhizobium sp. P17.1]MDF3186569.1 HAMP domain-containing protein [Mesorhizobium sp. ICCV3110.1]